MSLLKVRIITPKKLVYQAEVYSLSSTNSAGKFDILPEHANFITIIQNNDIQIVDSAKNHINFHFPLAIIYTSKNMINIYTDIPLTEQSLLNTH